MKRVLVAGVLGSLLLLGAPTLASSAPRSDTKAEKGDNAGKGGDNKGGDAKSGDSKGGKGDKGGDNKGGKDRDGRRDGDGRHRHGHHRGGYYGDYWYGYGGGYGGPYDCYYGRNGAYNCEEYGGDWDPYGGNYRGGYREGYILVRDNYSPQQANVRPGETVTWQFAHGDIPHTVTADNGSFDSGKKVDGEVFQLRLDHPGTYSYHCTFHPEMRGRVSVG